MFEAFPTPIISSLFFSFPVLFMVAEKDLKTTAFENSQSHGGSFYGADNSNYVNHYQVVTFILFFGIFFWRKS